MYNKLTFDQLCNINTKFFKNLQALYKRERYTFFKEFLKDIFREGNDIFYFDASQPVFRIIKNGTIRLIDEKEKIEIEATDVEINQIHNLLKNEKKVVRMNSNNKTILKTLLDDFVIGSNTTINGKPYLVYDIETIGNINDLKTMKFMMAYAVNSEDQANGTIPYRYVSDASVQRFAEFLLNYDGYIIGYNNIYFDNPVVAYNVGWGEEEIQIMKEKSIDLFLFIWNLTGRRLGLNAVASSLVNIGKTLSSGLEGEELLKEYLETGDKKALTKVKTYCRNDVKMTLGVLLYLLEYKNVFINEQNYDFTEEMFVELSSKERNSKNKSNGNDNTNGQSNGMFC